MNNEQFRRLLFDNTPTSKPKSASPTAHPQSSPSNHETRTSSTSGGTSGGPALGSRMRSSIPMTPRSLTKPDFARQLAEYRREGLDPPPAKKFKSSAAPKGSKLPAGYQDRAARLREGESASTNHTLEAELRLKELEEKLKKGLIDEGTFTKLRKELGFGADLDSTHMVKGLDWDLLRRVRAGEDVSTSREEERERTGSMEAEGKEDVPAKDEDGKVDVDEEFDKVLEERGEHALPSAPKEREKKKGSMAPPPAPPQRKTRDEILRELKASRAAAAAPAANDTVHEPALGARFKKIGDSKVEKKRWIEQDENGRRREVLLITDAEGKTKRKARWLDKPGATTGSGPAALPAPDKEVKPLGMEVPAEIAARAKASQGAEEDEDDDIFAGVGADYDPLGDVGSDDDSSESDEEGEIATTADKMPIQETHTEEKSRGKLAKPRNYFATTATEEEEEEEKKADINRANPLTKDPVLLAALKRAAALRQAPEHTAEDGEDVDNDTLLRRKKFLEEAQRQEALDAMDMDYGFGGSRNQDDEDDETVPLEGPERGGTKRKRGPKKRKGDKDSASDVLRVLEGRKKA